MALLLLYCTCKCITISCVFYFAFFGGMQPLPNQVNRQIFKHTHTHIEREREKEINGYIQNFWVFIQIHADLYVAKSFSTNLCTH